MNMYYVKLKAGLKKLLKKNGGMMNYHEKALSALFRHVDLKGKSVLIVGLGKGLEIPIFLSKGCTSVDAVEPFPIIKEESFGAKFKLHVGSAEQMPLQDGLFDVVYTLASLEHMQDPHKAVQEMMRVLKRNGVLFCDAGPFWYSPYGYHAKEKYPLLYDPWFHILYDEEAYVASRKDIAEQPFYKKHIHNIYTTSGYNRKKSRVYYDIVADLVREHIPLSIEISVQPENLLSKTAKMNKKLHTFSKRDLLTEGFTLVFRKA